MTYFGFLAVFLVPPILALLWLLRRSLRREHALALGLLMLIALLYTSPWDNYLVIRGVWTFDRAKTAEIFIWRAPLEEYLFYLLQVLITGLFTIWLMKRGLGVGGQELGGAVDAQLSIPDLRSPTPNPQPPTPASDA